jgi:hypothetical protein
MDLLDRYLQAVKKHLPWERQDDIVAELRANLEAQLEDKEAALGRPLTAAEAEDWLKQLGHPIQVAARYQPQRSLIGPALFPFYSYVMKLAFFWATLIYVILIVVQLATRTPSQIDVLAIVLRLPDGLLRTAMWVTVIFAIIEYAAVRCPGKFPMLAPPSSNWSPSALSQIDSQLAGGKRTRNYATAVAEVIFGFLFLVWWLLVPRHPYLLMGPGAAYLHGSPFQLSPVWVQFYWWVVVVNVAQLAWRTADLIRGNWPRPRTAETIVVSAIGLIPLGLLLSVPDHAYVLLRNPALDQARYGAALTSINHAIQWSAVAICAFTVLRLAWEIGRATLDAKHKRMAAIR